MTVVALGNFDDFQILLSDCIVQLSKNKDDYAIREKITRLGDSDCFISLTGDELVFHGIIETWNWVVKNNKKLDLFDKNNIDLILKSTEIIREARINKGESIIEHLPSTIFIINRGKNAIWQIEVEGGAYKRKKEEYFSIPLNKYFVSYSGDPIVNYDDLHIKQDESRQFLIDLIEYNHNKRKEEKVQFAINYEFDGYFTSVIVPKNSDEKIIESNAFSFLSDLIYGRFGGVGNIESTKDAAKKWTPKF